MMLDITVGLFLHIDDRKSSEHTYRSSNYRKKYLYRVPADILLHKMSGCDNLWLRRLFFNTIDMIWVWRSIPWDLIRAFPLLTVSSTNKSIWVKRRSRHVLSIAGEPTEKTKPIRDTVLPGPKCSVGGMVLKEHLSISPIKTKWRRKKKEKKNCKQIKAKSCYYLQISIDNWKWNWKSIRKQDVSWRTSIIGSGCDRSRVHRTSNF